MLEQLDIHIQKKKEFCYTQKLTQNATVLNAKPKTIQFLDKNTGEKPLYP